MIIEDNEDLRMLIAESLSDEFQVMQAGDGVESLKLIEHTDFDLIISDIMMPNKDGISLCNDIKGDMNTSHIPVILLTAKTSLESKIEGVDSGADLYFEKPVDGEGKNKGALVPKIVQLEYPALDDTGAVTTTTVQVPLITLVPVTASKIG